MTSIECTDGPDDAHHLNLGTLKHLTRVTVYEPTVPTLRQLATLRFVQVLKLSVVPVSLRMRLVTLLTTGNLSGLAEISIILYRDVVVTNGGEDGIGDGGGGGGVTMPASINSSSTNSSSRSSSSSTQSTAGNNNNIINNNINSNNNNFYNNIYNSNNDDNSNNNHNNNYNRYGHNHSSSATSNNSRNDTRDVSVENYQQQVAQYGYEQFLENLGTIRFAVFRRRHTTTTTRQSTQTQKTPDGMLSAISARLLTNPRVTAIMLKARQSGTDDDDEGGEEEEDVVVRRACCVYCCKERTYYCADDNKEEEELAMSNEQKQEGRIRDSYNCCRPYVYGKVITHGEPHSALRSVDVSDVLPKATTDGDGDDEEGDGEYYVIATRHGGYTVEFDSRSTTAAVGGERRGREHQVCQQHTHHHYHQQQNQQYQRQYQQQQHSQQREHEKCKLRSLSFEAIAHSTYPAMLTSDTIHTLELTDMTRILSKYYHVYYHPYYHHSHYYDNNHHYHTTPSYENVQHDHQQPHEHVLHDDDNGGDNIINNNKESKCNYDARLAHDAMLCRDVRNRLHAVLQSSATSITSFNAMWRTEINSNIIKSGGGGGGGDDGDGSGVGQWADGVTVQLALDVIAEAPRLRIVVANATFLLKVEQEERMNEFVSCLEGKVEVLHLSDLCTGAGDDGVSGGGGGDVGDNWTVHKEEEREVMGETVVDRNSTRGDNGRSTLGSGSTSTPIPTATSADKVEDYSTTTSTTSSTDSPMDYDDVDNNNDEQNDDGDDDDGNVDSAYASRIVRNGGRDRFMTLLYHLLSALNRQCRQIPCVIVHDDDGDAEECDGDDSVLFNERRARCFGVVEAVGVKHGEKKVAAVRQWLLGTTRQGVGECDAAQCDTR